MKTIYKQKQEWPNKAIYFLTDSCYLHFPYFRYSEQKQIVLNQIKKLTTKFNIPVIAYSISINHYHLKFYLEKNSDISRVKKILRGGISFEYRKRYKVPYKEMWQSRKILIINNEKSNWRTTGYIIGNLLKHKEVSTFKDLKNCIYSSYCYTVKSIGDSEAQNLVRLVINVEEDKWGVVDIVKFNFKNN